MCVIRNSHTIWMANWKEWKKKYKFESIRIVANEGIAKN